MSGRLAASGSPRPRAGCPRSLREAAQGPTIIHSRGHDLAVLLAIGEYERLVAEHPGGPGTGSAFLSRLDAVKRRHGGGVEEFKPAAMGFQSGHESSCHVLVELDPTATSEEITPAAAAR